MLISVISSVLSLMYNVMRLGRDFLLRFDLYKRNKNIHNRYKQGRRHVENGNIREINDIFEGD